jgi:RNA polymerase sigma-70 factor (ECF subfamily)
MNSSQRNSATSHCRNQEATVRDEILLIAARAGSHTAFGDLRNIYAHRLYQRTFSITRNREDAEDALQDTFLRAYRALPSFEGRSRFSSWLTRIAINSALMIIRKRRARPEMALEQQTGFGDEASSFDVRDNALNPEQLCDQKQRSYAILRAIQRLDPKSRTAMRIWVSQEHSMKEMAQDLGASLASIKARLHRARKRLSRSAALRNSRTELMLQDPTNLVLESQNRERPCLNCD